MKKHPLSDLDADIRDHIARETQANIDKGMTREKARYAALRAFGSVSLAQENTRAVWIPVWLDQFRQDIRYGLRMFGRNPVFTGVAVLTLALGIGLTTAVFSVVNAVLIQPLPYSGGDRIVVVRETHGELRGSASSGHFHDWTEATSVFEATAAGRATTFNLADAGDPERVNAMRVTPGYFQVAHMTPALGRYFTPADLEADERVVVLSEGLWKRRFGGDPSIVGRRIRLSDESFLVVGVAPLAYALTDPARASVVGGFSAQLWTPFVFSPEQRSNYGNHSLGVLAKLKPGITRAQAQTDLERVTRAIAERHPKEMESRSVDVQPLREVLTGNAEMRLFVLLALVVSVMLIGCVNIASLLLARAATRRKEIAIRASLGGGRPRIVRQLLTESLLLAGAGGLAGVIVAQSALRVFVNGFPANVPQLGEAGLQPEVLLFALAISMVSAAVFGTAPAIRAARADLQGALRDARGSSLHGPSRDRLRALMVVAEIAVTVVVLVGAGLLFRSALRVQQVSLGFNPDQVLTARLTLPAARYREPEAVTDAYRRMLEPLRTVSGESRVRAAASTNVPFVSGTSTDSSLTVEGMTFPPGASPSPHIRLVTDEYFEAIGMNIVRGRPLQGSDMVKGAPQVVVINERLAAHLWPGGDPLRKRVSGWTAGLEPEWREVVGVVADVRTFGKTTAVPLEMFLPYTQAPKGSWDVFQRSMVLVLRAVYPETYTAQMRSAVKAVDPSLPM
jgi:putative ABC transport system permease protein